MYKDLDKLCKYCQILKMDFNDWKWKALERLVPNTSSSWKYKMDS